MDVVGFGGEVSVDVGVGIDPDNAELVSGDAAGQTGNRADSQRVVAAEQHRQASGGERRERADAEVAGRADRLPGPVYLAQSPQDGRRHRRRVCGGDDARRRGRAEAGRRRGRQRPGAEPVPVDEEWRRIEPVLRHALGLGVAVSVDTCKPEVMRRALDLGVDIVNDVAALRVVVTEGTVRLDAPANAAGATPSVLLPAGSVALVRGGTLLVRSLPLADYTVLICEFANWADTAPLPCFVIKREK